MKLTDYSNEQIISIVDGCISQAVQKKSKIDREMLPVHAGGSIEGCEGVQYRHLLNNIGAAFTNINYLECGIDVGASLFTVANNNLDNFNIIYAIDGWVHHFAPRKVIFEANFDKFVKDKSKFKIITHDDMKLDLINMFLDKYVQIGHTIDIFYYDAHHADPYQFESLNFYRKFLDNKFLYIVDDADADDTKFGIKRGLDELKDLKLVHRWDLETGWRPGRSHNPETWVNGIFIGLFEKI